MHLDIRNAPAINIAVRCLLFVLLTLQAGMQVMPAALIAIGATFVFRVLAIQFNWKTSPVWQEPPNRPSP